MSEKMPESNSDSSQGEKIEVDKLIVMDDVSGLADRCEDISNFLTVSRKYGFSWTKLGDDNVSNSHF